MNIVIEKVNFGGIEIARVIPTENGVEFISKQLKKYEFGIGEHPYFNWYRERMVDDGEDYRFSWQCNYDDTEMIADTKTAYIYESKDKQIEWTII